MMALEIDISVSADAHGGMFRHTSGDYANVLHSRGQLIEKRGIRDKVTRVGGARGDLDSTHAIGPNDGDDLCVPMHSRTKIRPHASKLTRSSFTLFALRQGEEPKI